jgi:hypothetical protein
VPEFESSARLGGAWSIGSGGSTPAIADYFSIGYCTWPSPYTRVPDHHARTQISIRR